MTSYQVGSRVIKGALVSVETFSLRPSVIPFQYNPATLKRSLKPLMVGGESGDRSQAVRLTGAPIETLSVEIELDATDALDSGDVLAQSMGIHPQLAALELLVFPSTTHVIVNEVLLALGTIEISPMTAPRILFVWGPQRVQPVQISSYSISEEEFDTRLNPIRATVSLEMRVLTYSDLSVTNMDFYQYMAYQQSLEAVAASARTADTGILGGVSIL